MKPILIPVMALLSIAGKPAEQDADFDARIENPAYSEEGPRRRGGRGRSPLGSVGSTESSAARVYLLTHQPQNPVVRGQVVKSDDDA